MSYHHPDIINATDPDVILGRAIYTKALGDRRGFADRQQPIDADIWAEIFIQIAQVARAEIKAERENKT